MVRASRRRAWGHALDPVQLIDFTRLYAADAARGSYPFVSFDMSERWHRRIYRDPRVDVWLISWLPTQGTQLHDHGGSAGAFTVVRGELTESVVRRGALSDVRSVAGRSVGFGPRHVHDVRNLGPVPAVSVHAYSPPLTSMTFYELDSGGLRRVRSLVTDDPESGAPRLAS